MAVSHYYSRPDRLLDKLKALRGSLEEGPSSLGSFGEGPGVTRQGPRDGEGISTASDPSILLLRFTASASSSSTLLRPLRLLRPLQLRRPLQPLRLSQLPAHEQHGGGAAIRVLTSRGVLTLGADKVSKTMETLHDQTASSSVMGSFLRINYTPAAASKPQKSTT